MRYAGRIAEWNDERGFGFVEPNGGGDRAFVHVRAFRGRRPREGTRVTYAVQRDARKRLTAIDVEMADAGTQRSASDHATPKLPRKWIGLASLAAIGLAVWLHQLPLPVLLVYAGMSVITFGAYLSDKSAAHRGNWRTPENMLHLLALAGGWPGALVAQDVFRHKTRKMPFQVNFWITVAMNVAAVVWFVSLR